jgi:polar amino acid transport system substrate-binding protein
MKNRSLNALILIALGLAVPLRNCSAQVKTLRIATSADFPPMESVSTTNEIVGFDIDFMKAVAAEAGFTPEFTNVSWYSIFSGLESGAYDAVISSVSITEERKRKYDISIPYIKVDQVVLLRADLDEAESLKDLAGRRIAFLRGSNGETSLNQADPNEEIVRVPCSDITTAFQQLEFGRAEGIICEHIYAILATQEPTFVGKFKIMKTPLLEDEYGIVVKKGNAAVLNLINKGVMKVLQKGMDQEIKEQWFRYR